MLKVDHMFKEVFALSKLVYKASDGYFDPTVGTLVNAGLFKTSGYTESYEMASHIKNSIDRNMDNVEKVVVQVFTLTNTRTVNVSYIDRNTMERDALEVVLYRTR